MAEKARLARTKAGLVPQGRGWFVVNAAEARWRDSGPFGLYCAFEGKPARASAPTLEPGHEEDFLVLDGECLLAAARRHGVSVERETDDRAVAYADVPRRRPASYGGWLR